MKIIQYANNYNLLHLIWTCAEGIGAKESIKLASGILTFKEVLDELPFLQYAVSYA